MKYLVIVFLLIAPLVSQSQCTHPDYDGLMELFNSANSVEWIQHRGWREGSDGESCDPCDFNGQPWEFITCDQGRVKAIHFESVELEGELPNFKLDELEEFSVEFSLITGISDFSNTPKLKKLILKTSLLEGSIPDLHNTSIEVLELSTSMLTGEIDVSVFPDLKELNLFRNDLSGTIPKFDNLQNLSSLILSNNALEGPVPEFELPQLKSLYLSHNQLSGTLPNFEFLPELFTISLTNNFLTGTIHTFVYNHKISGINLSTNLFTGPVPDFVDHPNFFFIFLSASNNDLSGCYPDHLKEVMSLEVHGNDKLPFRGNVLKYRIFESLINAPCSPSDSIKYGTFDFDNCECIPGACEIYKDDFEALVAFYNATNGDDWLINDGWKEGVEGTSCAPCDYGDTFDYTWYGVKCFEGRVIGIDLDGTDDFTQIGVGGNNLSGAMPPLDLNKLEELYLDDNSLTGEIPSLSNAPLLETLIVSRNELSGNLSSLENAKNLKIFRGSFNNLTGPLPDLSGLDSLETFTCSNNLLEGCLDNTLCDIPLVDLRFNEALPWSGEIVSFCDGAAQIGAPCNLMADEEYIINEDCECVLKLETHTDDVLNNPIICFPNPTSHFVNISGYSTNTIFTIYNTHAVSVMTSQNSRIDVSTLPQGLYYIDVSSQSNLALKFLKI